MRILTLHSDYIKFAPTKPAMKGVKDVKKEETEVKECLVVLTAVEKEDEKAIECSANLLAEEIINISKDVKTENIVLYPYAHLSSDLASPKNATKIMEEAEKQLKKAKLNVVKAPFGWYKKFELACKGHPMAELSRELIAEAEKTKKERKEGSEFAEFIAVDEKGKEYKIDPKNINACKIWDQKGPAYDRLKQFIKNEISKKQGGKEPKHIEYMRKLELVDYCDVSEPGHFKWYPKGVLIKRLLLQYARDLALKWGASEMSNPLLIKGGENTVGELMGEFHERDYKVDGGRGIGFLRYASDPLGFPFMQKVRFTYKQTPLKVYEEATCFRNEQAGEVSGLKRVRNFLMTDMHAACSSDKEAMEEYKILCLKFGELMNNIIAKGRWVLGWEGTIDFYNKNKKYLIEIGKELKVPAFFKLSKGMSHYYAIKNEYQTILEDNSNIQVSTVQWDVKDGKRFDIGYIGKDGKKHPCPVIIHASSFGSIERTLCSILENVAIDEKAGKPTMLPLWLSPTQIRVIPVSTEKHLKIAEKIAEELEKENIRVDIDDNEETVGKRIKNSEEDWVPYTLVVGDKETKSDKIMVRIKEINEEKEMTKQNLVKEIKKKTENTPFLPLPLPKLLSKRPIFVG